MVKYYKVNRLLGAVHSRGYLPDASVWYREHMLPSLVYLGENSTYVHFRFGGLSDDRAAYGVVVTCSLTRV